jgi:2-polyprenyl-3-methyl-5-hydroxy-6-metoxy-1,4-benzoquinol methylase
MTGELRDILLARYGETQASTGNPGALQDVRAPWPYYEENYGGFIRYVARESRILDVGCGQGNLLGWLSSHGFEHLAGVDASPADVELANARLGRDVVVYDDATVFLERQPRSFDAIFAKALLEHIPRGELLRFVRALASAVKADGLIVIDVPNMDWLLASHERYMDMTHESGFTRESLTTLLSLEFGEVEVVGSRLAAPTRSQRLLRSLVLRLLRRFLYVLGEGASDVLVSSRSLVAVAQAPGGSGPSVG